MKAILWIIANFGMIAALWFGLVEGIDGALNIGILMVWFATLTSFFMLNEKVTDDLIKKQGGRSVPDWVSWASGVTVVLILTWHGWLWTAGAFLLAAFVQQGALTQSRRRLDDQES